MGFSQPTGGRDAGVPFRKCTLEAGKDGTLLHDQEVVRPPGHLVRKHSWNTHNYLFNNYFLRAYNVWARHRSSQQKGLEGCVHSKCHPRTDV